MFYGNWKEFQLVALTHFLAVLWTFFQESEDTSITNALDREFSQDHKPWKTFRRPPAAPYPKPILWNAFDIQDPWSSCGSSPPPWSSA
jgi:hypothetical protein